MLRLIFSVSTLWWMILFLYIPACFGLIVIVLLQRGKGQGLAGAFGMGGGMDTIFGPRSSKSLPQKITYASAAVFMSLALIMSILSGKVGRASAPALVTDAPQATFEALFDPMAAPESVAITEEADDATDEETVSEIPVPQPAPLDSLFEVLPLEEATEEPGEETPDAEEPAVEESVEETSEIEAVAEEALDDTPAEEPVEEAVIDDTPAEAPVEEVIIDDTPAEAPVEDAPAEEPVEEEPVDEEHTEEAPAE